MYNLGVTSVEPRNGYSEVTFTMQDYYSMYTWVMDRQAELERQLEAKRQVRQSRHVNLRLRWPVLRRRIVR